MEDRLELAKMIGALRAELNQAQREGADEAIRFAVEEVELEFNVEVSAQEEGSLGVKFFVFTGGAKIADKDVVTQKIKLKMKALTKDESGKKSPAEISHRRPAQ